MLINSDKSQEYIILTADIMSDKKELSRSPGTKTNKPVANERMDPKILDSRVRGLIVGAKDKLQRLAGEVAGLRKEAATLQEALDLSNSQKADLARKEDDHKAKLADIKKENEELLAKRNELDQQIIKAKDELQGLIKLHNQNVKSYTTKLSQMNTKERQEVLKREETKTSISQQIAHIKKDNEELKLSIADLMKKTESMKETIAQSKEIEQKRLDNLGREMQDLEALISANP